MRWLILSLILSAAEALLFAAALVTMHNSFWRGWQPDPPHALIGVTIAARGVLCVFVIQRLDRRTALILEKYRLLENQVKTQSEHYESLRLDIQQGRKLRHDQRNHLAAVSHLLERGRLDEAKAILAQYARQIEDSTARTFCRNPIVDAVLRGKVTEAEELHIECRFDVSLDEKLAIDEIDLSSVFANVLDNAIYACGTLADESEQCVLLSAAVKGGYLVVKCKNPAGKKNTGLIPVREDAPNHGFGLLILEEIARKYYGSRNILSDEKYFQITMFLKLKEELWEKG
ncbi:MAG: GHKL domain-containing protein [Clostridiales bacterium]|jgi:sensor histidine kinase regulating citrate/malate metabolism|nr:GHKL domain-containing protein [Clostridiales bacterium]